MVNLSFANGSITFATRVQPRASRSEVAGELDGALKVRLAAPPVDGEANEELIRFLAKLFDVPRRQVSLLSGLTSKNKLIRVEGVTADEGGRILQAVLSG
ncbi:MAG: DUF167 domain-containing protein [Acidobacteriota bacterium]